MVCSGSASHAIVFECWHNLIQERQYIVDDSISLVLTLTSSRVLKCWKEKVGTTPAVVLYSIVLCPLLAIDLKWQSIVAIWNDRKKRLGMEATSCRVVDSVSQPAKTTKLPNHHRYPWFSQLLMTVRLAFSGSNICPSLICFSSSTCKTVPWDRFVHRKDDRVPLLFSRSRLTIMESAELGWCRLLDVSSAWETCTSSIVAWRSYFKLARAFSHAAHSYSSLLKTESGVLRATSNNRSI